MTVIDPKWISYDGDTLEIIVDGGANKISVKLDPDGSLVASANGIDIDLQALVDNNSQVLLVGMNAQYINNINVQVRKASEGVPVDDVTDGRDNSKDFYIEIPD